MLTVRSLTRRRAAVGFAAAVATSCALLLSACAPGSTSKADPPSSKAAGTDVAAKPVTLTLLVTTGVDQTLFGALGTLFHAAHPNVTVTVKNQDYNTLTTNIAHILSGSDVPDLVRVPQFGNLIKDNLLAALDGYAKAYGWDSWSQSQFASTRVGTDGRQRGSGSLYGAGPGFGLTGIYYNAALARRIGMTSPPATLAQFEQLLAKAKAAGLQPIMVNGKDGGTVYPLQNLQMDYAGDAQPLQRWNYAQPGANINTAATVHAAATLQQWSRAGYLPSDVNGIDQTQAPVQFTKGTGVFFPSGNWQAPGLDKAGAGKFGFFLFPPVAAGQQTWAMTAPDTLAIPAKSSHAETAAAFLNFIQTDPKAREDAVKLGGIVPAGPSDAAVPATPAGSAVGATVSAFQALLKNNGLVSFMADATASINVNTLLPQTQLLLGDKTSPKAYAAKVQADYRDDLQH